MSSVEINVEGVRNPSLRDFLRGVGEEIKRQEAWPLTKTEAVDKFSPVIMGTSLNGDLRWFVNNLVYTKVVDFNYERRGVRKIIVLYPDQVKVTAALYWAHQQEPRISRLSKLVPKIKEALGDHPLANSINTPQKQKREGKKVDDKTKTVEPREALLKKPNHIPEISEEQLNQAHQLDSAGLDKLQQNIANQPVLDEISFSRTGIKPEQALMILFIRAVDSRAFTYFYPDLGLEEIPNTNLRNELIDGIKRCLRILGDYKKRANAEGKETTVKELGELFLRVKWHVEKINRPAPAE